MVTMKKTDMAVITTSKMTRTVIIKSTLYPIELSYIILKWTGSLYVYVLVIMLMTEMSEQAIGAL